MAENPPYVLALGTLAKILEKIKAASTPERFTQDFLGTKLGMRGGTANAAIPYLKRTGFLNGDGTPTELYRQFRNPAQTGQAAARALRHGYASLYEINEYAHDLDDNGLRGVILQATGLDHDNRVVAAVLGSFKTLKQLAKFDGEEPEPEPEKEREKPDANNTIIPVGHGGSQNKGVGMNLSYTINLNLPATTDIKVFDAIFKSLREHLLKQ